MAKGGKGTKKWVNSRVDYMAVVRRGSSAGEANKPIVVSASKTSEAGIIGQDIFTGEIIWQLPIGNVGGSTFFNPRSMLPIPMYGNADGGRWMLIGNHCNSNTLSLLTVLMGRSDLSLLDTGTYQEPLDTNAGQAHHGFTQWLLCMLWLKRRS